MDIIELKSLLKEIKLNEWAVPDEFEPGEFVLSLVPYLASIDAELRDGLVYEMISQWIIDGILCPDDIAQLANVLTGEEYLFYNIGEADTPSVFKRSFSMLLLAPILLYHRENGVFTIQQVMGIKEKVIRFAIQEKDVRGYVNPGGWAHTVAHTADIIDELFQCEELYRTDMLELLDAVSTLILKSPEGYRDGEDDRLSYAVGSLIKRGILSDVELIAWLETFSNPEVVFSRLETWHRANNVKAFLKSLYFRVAVLDQAQGLAEYIKNKLFKLMKIELEG